MIEHYAGAFPVWLSPIQVQIIPVGSRHIKPSQKLAKELVSQDLRCHVDDLNETVSYKIRKAEKMKIPYILVIGDKEVTANPVGSVAAGFSLRSDPVAAGFSLRRTDKKRTLKSVATSPLNIRIRGQKAIKKMNLTKFIEKIRIEIERKK